MKLIERLKEPPEISRDNLFFDLENGVEIPAYFFADLIESAIKFWESYLALKVNFPCVRIGEELFPMALGSHLVWLIPSLSKLDSRRFLDASLVVEDRIVEAILNSRGKEDQSTFPLDFVHKEKALSLFGERLEKTFEARESSPGDSLNPFRVESQTRGLFVQHSLSCVVDGLQGFGYTSQKVVGSSFPSRYEAHKDIVKGEHIFFVSGRGYHLSPISGRYLVPPLKEAITSK